MEKVIEEEVVILEEVTEEAEEERLLKEMVEMGLVIVRIVKIAMVLSQVADLEFTEVEVGLMERVDQNRVLYVSQRCTWLGTVLVRRSNLRMMKMRICIMRR